MKAEPWLCLGGVEVGSALRTLTYLRRGLGGSAFSVGLANQLVAQAQCRQEVVGDDYPTTYPTVYPGSYATVCDQDEFTPQNLRCYCPALDDSDEQPLKNYVSPADDDAAWYSADRVESGDFLGFIPWSVTLRPTLARAAAHGSKGATLGPQTAGGFMVEVAGTMYAASRAGMEYGERWLTAMLAGELCDDDRDLRVLPACPVGNNPAQFRTLEHTGTIDGPVFAPVQDGVAECVAQTATFQLVSESPWMISDAVDVFDDESLFPNRTTRHLATQGEYLGDAALRITVSVPSGTDDLVGLAIAGYPTTADACPSANPTPAWSFSVPDVPAGHTLVVDAVLEVVTVTNQATGAVIGSLDYLDYDGLMPWPVLVACSQQCVEASTHNTPRGTKITVEQFTREF